MNDNTIRSLHSFVQNQLKLVRSGEGFDEKQFQANVRGKAEELGINPNFVVFGKDYHVEISPQATDLAKPRGTRLSAGMGGSVRSQETAKASKREETNPKNILMESPLPASTGSRSSIQRAVGPQSLVRDTQGWYLGPSY